MKELQSIQSKLKAPKSQYNNFGKYPYRSCEDILEAVKPLLAEEKCTLTISDDITMIGDWIYVKATATLTNESGTKEQTTAFAREEAVKKGMDAAQITGSTSSYARKYALNGLFCIDDTKDPDTTNQGNQGAAKQTAQPTKNPAKSTSAGKKVVPMENLLSEEFLKSLHDLDKKNRAEGKTKPIHSILESRYVLTNDEIKQICRALGEYEKSINEVL